MLTMPQRHENMVLTAPNYSTYWNRSWNRNQGFGVGIGIGVKSTGNWLELELKSDFWVNLELESRMGRNRASLLLENLNWFYYYFQFPLFIFPDSPAYIVEKNFQHRTPWKITRDYSTLWELPSFSAISVDIGQPARHILLVTWSPIFQVYFKAFDLLFRSTCNRGEWAFYIYQILKNYVTIPSNSLYDCIDTMVSLLDTHFINHLEIWGSQRNIYSTLI